MVDQSLIAARRRRIADEIADLPGLFPQIFQAGRHEMGEMKNIA